MVFLSICTALYDYVPQGDGELAIQEGEIIYILEKSTEDDWWKAKKKAVGEEDEEPVGLIPNNYVEEAQPTHNAKALYDYSRQTDEELSFSEDDSLLVYDTSDPDWTLVGLDGEFGFAPSNYIEIKSGNGQIAPPVALSPPLPKRESKREVPPTPAFEEEAPRNPATALAGIMHNRGSGTSTNTQQSPTQESSRPARRIQFTPEASDDEPPTLPPPSLPQRPASGQVSPSSPLVTQYATPQSPEAPGIVASPPYNRATSNTDDPSIPGGYRLYSVNEMVAVMGKHKKMPTTLGINLATGTIIIIPAKKRDGLQQEWTAEKLTHYSIEGKHVFMELVRPSKSIDFHAGAKDTAEEIVSALGELAGVARAEGLREVIAAGTGSGSKGQRKGYILYDFMAQGDDEVTLAVGDEVVILDDTKSEEWWKVRRVKNGNEGVVPSSYVEVTGTITPPESSSSGLNAGRSTVEQNRLEETRMTNQNSKASRNRNSSDSRGSEVGPGMKLPNRDSSLIGRHDSNLSSQRNKRDSRSDNKPGSKTKPDGSKVRTWTDRSGSFKVDAQFVGLKDGKIQLHKLNGVKIAVPVIKMATEDLEYVESVTGVSLDEDKPLSDIRRKSQKAASDRNNGSGTTSSVSAAGASVQKKPEYDWFDFFLKSGVSPYQCERYSSNFNRDSMDETVLADITPAVLRNLGLKEGDVLRVMKFLDGKFGRVGGKSKLRNVSFGGEEVMGKEDGDDGATSPGGGLFSGPGGTLKNNTRKGRPAPTVQTNDVVSPKAFQQNSEKDEFKPPPIEKNGAPLASAPPEPISKLPGRFDDDAWDVKPPKQAARLPSTPAVPQSTTPAPVVSAPPTRPALTGAMADLSLLSQPLQPIITHSNGNQPLVQSQQFNQSQQQVPTSQQFSQPSQQTSVPQSYAHSQSQQAPLQQQFVQPQYLPNIQNASQPQQQVQQPVQQQPTGASPAFFGQLVQQSSGLQPQQGFLPQAPLPQSANPQFQLGSISRQRPQPPQFNQQSSLIPPPPPRPLSAPQNAPAQSNFGPPPLQPQLTGIPNQAGYQNQMMPGNPSLEELNRLKLLQQFNSQQQGQPSQLSQQQFMPQMTGINPNQQMQAFNQFGTSIPPQQQNIYQQPQIQPQQAGVQPSPLFLTGQQPGSPFSDPRSQPQSAGFSPLSATLPGFSPQFYNPLAPQQTGSINSMLSPPLQPQITAMNGFGRPAFGQTPPPLPPIPQQPTLAPLQAQKTGPAPPVRFGTANVKPLMAQPTGMKANLSQATPQNPFGF